MTGIIQNKIIKLIKLKNMQDIFNDIFKAITAPLPVVPCNSISMIVDDERQKLEEGMGVHIRNKQLVSMEPVTHIITACRGKWDDSYFELSVIDIRTKELSIIKL